MNAVIASTPGSSVNAVFSMPRGITYDPSAKRLVVVTNDAIEQIDPSSGTVTTLAQNSGAQGAGGSCAFLVPIPPAAACLGGLLAVTASPSGLFVAQSCSSEILETLDGGALQYFAGANEAVPPGLLTAAASDGPASSVVFAGDEGDQPFGFLGLWEDPQGVLWVANTGERRIQRIADGWVDLVAGGGGPGIFDGPGAEASFLIPRAIVGDGQGNLWVGDGAAIRQIDADLQVTTFSGNPEEVGHVDGPPNKAEFQDILGITRAGDGTLYVLDGTLVGDPSEVPVSSTPTQFVLFVRRIDSSGNVTTVAGDGEPSTAYRDGPALHVPVDGFFLAVDPEDKNVYLTAPFANRVRVLRLP
ncbi:MAG: NHL repeat-containing protein [Myxococcales bacterium]